MAATMDIDHGAPSKCYIKELPLEVLLRVTYSLKTTELCNLRLSCRGIEELLRNSFAREFFSCKQFMISEFSLQALVDISKSRMGPYLTRLQIGLEQFIPPHTIFVHTLDMRAREYGLEEHIVFNHNRCAALYGGQCALWSSGVATEMLTEALRNLSNLKDIVLRDNNSRTRRRDWPATEWRSYGIVTALREAGALVGGSGQSSSFQYANIADQIFALVLHSMGKANARVRGIEIICRKFCHLSDSAFSLPQYARTSVVPVIESLEKLHITLNADSASRDEVDNAKTLFEEFMYHAKNMRDLRINGPTGRGGPGLLPFVKCLGNTDPDTLGPGVVELPQLTTLSLGFIEAEAEVFLALVEKFSPTLESLELWKVTMSQSAKLKDLEADADDDDDVSACRYFMKQLLEIPSLDLHHFKVGCLGEMDHYNKITSLATEFEGSGTTISYTGIDWRHFVQEAIPSLRLTEGRRYVGRRDDNYGRSSPHSIVGVGDDDSDETGTEDSELDDE